MYTFIKQFGKSLLDLIYPPLCFHCENLLEVNQPLFCQDCLNLLELIDPKERCPVCFSADFQADVDQCCTECLKKPSLIKQTAAAFDYEGPAASLVKQIKYHGQPHLTKGASAYLATQFLHLDWPTPDFIVPMPMATLRYMERGYNQSALLAKSLSFYINCPYLEVLGKKSGSFSQAGLNHQQRLQLQSEHFFIKRQIPLKDATVLLIDDVMTTGTSLQCSAKTLQKEFCKDIYALTLCRAF